LRANAWYASAAAIRKPCGASHLGVDHVLVAVPAAVHHHVERAVRRDVERVVHDVPHRCQIRSGLHFREAVRADEYSGFTAPRRQSRRTPAPTGCRHVRGHAEHPDDVVEELLGARRAEPVAAGISGIGMPMARTNSPGGCGKISLSSSTKPKSKLTYDGSSVASR
jgi:hypothetical protein